MTRHLSCLVLACLASSSLAAEDAAPRYAGVRIGESFSAKSNINAYAVTWRHGWIEPRPLGQSWQWQVDWEYALAEWQADVPDGRNFSNGRDETLVASVSPVLRFSMTRPVLGGLEAFFEGGIGASYFQHKKLAAYDYSEGDLGSHLQFEDRVSLGFTLPRYRDIKFVFSIFHYSNANLGDANYGINLRMLSIQVPL